MDLSELIRSNLTAVVTMELQRAVVGDLAVFPDLRDAAVGAGVVENAGRLCAAARSSGASVVHCTAEFRPDRRGSALNSRILVAAQKLNGDRLDVGNPGTELVAALDQQPGDLVVARSHGLTPFTSTELDQVLRNCGVQTIVVAGASLNVGVVGLVLTAVDLGYQVVVPRDAVVGVPVDYGAAMLDHTISVLATVVETDQIVAIWG